MKPSDIAEFMRSHGIRRIERHVPTSELPYEWFSVELDDSRMIGTGPTIADALAKAADIREQLARQAA